MRILLVLVSVGILASCGNETWTCQTRGQAMYSMSSFGEIGSANIGCSCAEIRAFEFRTFGEVDEVALKIDFGC